MHFLTIRKLCELIFRKEVPASEVLKQALSRAHYIKHLNAFVSLRGKPASTACGGAKTVLSGVPYALKDNFSSKEFNTTCGSQMLQRYAPSYDATALKKLSSAGAILMGKTNLDEFAMGSGSVDSVFQPVKNPWTPGILHEDSNQNNWRIAGGSSGGSAVAVATGACTFAIGSDTGGSVRNPASYCGVVGFKPTYGMVSRHGLIPLVNSMDCPSIFARSVDDAAIVLQTLKGRDLLDSTTVDTSLLNLLGVTDTSVRDLRVGIPKECLVLGMSRAVIDAWKWAADQFENAGAKVFEVSLPHMKDSIICYHILCAAEVASNMARFDGLKYGHRSAVKESSDAMTAVSRKESLNDTVRNRILVGNYFLLKENRKKYFEKAQKVRRMILQDYLDVFGKTHPYQLCETYSGVLANQCDVLLSPVVLSDAPLYSEFVKEDNRTRSAEQDVLTQSANMAGVPAMSIPSKISSNGLPIGLQITGSHFSERTVIKAAMFLEEVAEFPTLEHRFQDNAVSCSAKTSSW